MRHGRKFNHLGRTNTHRKSMLSNMANSLILVKKIETTVSKAKELKKYIEPLITKAKDDSTHSRRTVFSYLKHKEPIKELFSTVIEKVGDRPGGYTRILKTGKRLGDNAEMCIIELVDFNETYTIKKEDTKVKTRRSRSKATGTKSSIVDATVETIPSESVSPTDTDSNEVVDAIQTEEVNIDATPTETTDIAENIVSEEVDTVENTNETTSPDVDSTSNGDNSVEGSSSEEETKEV